MDAKGVLSGLREGNRYAISKAISSVENHDPNYREIADATFGASGQSTIIGVTGSPGVGKSSLIGRAALEMRRRGRMVAVVAIDPTSHISGGAFLADGIRMSSLRDAGVYVRSMASRGEIGGVNSSLRDVIRVLGYAKYDTIVVESVGAGQTEVALSKVADINMVLLNPESGDAFQLNKAGLMETGDIFVVTKSDLEGAATLYNEMRDFLLESGSAAKLLQTSSRQNRGVIGLCDLIESLEESKNAAKPERASRMASEEFNSILLNSIRDRVAESVKKSRDYKSALDGVVSGKESPAKAALRLSSKLKI